MSNFNKRNRFHMERLEDRQMMAGDIHAFLNNGTLFIHEAANSIGGAQELEIAYVNGNKVRVTAAQGMLINGKSSVLFETINGLDIDAKLGGGKDVVHVTGPGAVGSVQGVVKIDTADPAFSPNDEDVVTARNLTIAQLDITTGSGHDVVEVANTNVNGELGLGNLNIRAGINTLGVFSDQDTVVVGLTHVQHDMSLLTGASNDRVILKNVDVGKVDGDLLWVDLGAQDDVLDLGSGLNDFTPVTGIALRVDARDGNDRVAMADVFFNAGIAVQLGAGEDVLNMRNVQSRTNMSVRGEGGNDTMILQQVEAFDNFFAFMGEGSDTLDITFIKARKVELDGGDGAGYDKLFLSQSPNIPTLIRRGFEEINGQKLILKATVTGPVSR
jgi:hypothetical protein